MDWSSCSAHIQFLVVDWAKNTSYLPNFPLNAHSNIYIKQNYNSILNISKTWTLEPSSQRTPLPPPHPTPTHPMGEKIWTFYSSSQSSSINVIPHHQKYPELYTYSWPHKVQTLGVDLCVNDPINSHLIMCAGTFFFFFFDRTVHLG